MSQTLFLYNGSFDPTSGKFATSSTAAALGAYTISGTGPFNLVAGSTTYTYQGYDSGGSAVYSSDGGTTNVLVSTSSAIGVKALETGDSSESSFGPSLSCFLTGTLIATPSGQVAVEALRVGDRASLAAGGSSAIVWIGHRSLDCSTHAAPQAVLPIRVAAHAFGDDLPRRDLFLSPEHAVFAEGVLIPVRHLVNGGSIAQVAAQSITYWHIEVEGHQVVLAENLPVESYLENEARSELEMGGVTVLHPMFAGTVETPLAPMVTQGPILQKVRDQVAARDLGRPAIAA